MSAPLSFDDGNGFILHISGELVSAIINPRKQNDLKFVRDACTKSYGSAEQVSKY